MRREIEVLHNTIKEYMAAIIAIISFSLIAIIVFYLYSLPIEPVLYIFLLMLFFGVLIFVITYIKNLKKAKEREHLLYSVRTDDAFPEAENLLEKDYQEMIVILKKELADLRNTYETARQEEVDYYTTWVHQIKTPIAVLRMQLGECEMEFSRKMEPELFRIEQYVDMVLQYIRLDSVNDLVVTEHSLDELIRETIRKYAAQFVYKRLKLVFEGTTRNIITDKKWFSCIIEQLISNAIKYTNSGCITIVVKDDILQISDTGIGIAKEDIPRIFEKGFTGRNGHVEKQSSGLGLYLCKRAATLLDINISVDSTVDEGTTFSLDLSGKCQ